MSAAVDPSAESITIHGHRYGRADLDLGLFLGIGAQDVALLSKLADTAAGPELGFITDLYGIRTRTANLWPEMHPHDGAFTGVPVPGNFHWEAIEWVAIMKSVLSAGARYRLMEMGAGWGPATVAGAVLARLRGIKDIHVTAVEADPYHFKFLQQHLSDNKLDLDQYTLLEAAVGAEAGQAEWPDASTTAIEFGNRPITSAGDYLGRTITRTRPVQILAATDLIQTQSLWDMLHVDVQGTELDIFQTAMELCNQRVARVCIGTHSRKIDGILLELFYQHGWIMEHEKPTKMTFIPDAKTLEAMNSADGTQVWRNPRLRPEAVSA